jgi:hypothetical protein
MPKIDWRDDDQPRWERLYHPRRLRQPYQPGSLARYSVDRFPLLPTLRAAQPQDGRASPAARRPLHLIWGEPSRPAPPP